MIDVQDLKKVFVTEEVKTHALSSIHQKIHKVEYVAIAGPSGCGKSTLLSILGLLDSPSEGNYNINKNASHAQRTVHLFDGRIVEDEKKVSDEN